MLGLCISVVALEKEPLMDWYQWDERAGTIGSRMDREVNRSRVQVRTLPPLVAQSTDTGTGDYQVHMLLSALMLIAALVIANLH
jgi:hypothetical protein